MPRPTNAQLTISQILAWADEHYERTGRWPTKQAGRVRGARGWTWGNIDAALRYGRFGLRGGDSLHKLLERRRGKPARAMRPRLKVSQILRWAEEHKRRTGRWPNQKSGRVVGVRGETWLNIDASLRMGYRGMPGGSSLPLLLDRYGRKQHKDHPPRLTIKQILEWADAHKRRTGRWPSMDSGLVVGSRGKVTWQRIQESLYHGQRGLKGGSSLAEVLDRYRRRGRGA